MRRRTFVCPDEYEFVLQRLCEREYRDISSMVRECIRREAVRQRLWHDIKKEGHNG